MEKSMCLHEKWTSSPTRIWVCTSRPHFSITMTTATGNGWKKKSCQIIWKNGMDILQYLKFFEFYTSTTWLRITNIMCYDICAYWLISCILNHFVRSWVMLSLHRITTNLGPIYEWKNSGFLGLVSSRKNFIVRSQASVYINVGERLTYE